jgi:predicted CXXCH cytochrome family protein
MIEKKEASSGMLCILLAAITVHLTGLPVRGQDTAGDLVAGSVDTCIDCHLELGNDEWGMPEAAEPALHFQDDIHFHKELSCANCHGGDPTAEDMFESMSEEAGFVGAPSRQELPEFCGKCHSNPEYMQSFNPLLPTDQVAKYYTSHHGKMLMEGNEKVAVCTDCHMTHGIKTGNDATSTVFPANIPSTCARCHADEEYMKDSGLPTDQYRLYSKSVHGVALLDRGDTAAPACNDCHGNHGANPPGELGLELVCGNCHAQDYELYVKSPHYEAFQEYGFPNCATCHSNHDVESPDRSMIGVNESAVCMQCHSEGDAGYKVAESLSRQLDSIASSHEDALKSVEKAEQVGMLMDDAFYALDEARQLEIQAKTLTHSQDVDRMREHLKEAHAKTASAKEMAEKALKDYNYRRTGLGWASVIFTLFALVLFLKIRQIAHGKAK